MINAAVILGAALKGLLLMLSVIVAIGPQNAFLLRQSVRHDRAFLTAGIFLFGDVSMILLGGFGIGHLLEHWPLLKFALTVLGSTYILWFGIGVLRQMINPKALTVGDPAAEASVVAGALAVTFLNPHAIFDTVILVGTLALQFPGTGKTAFMIGAILGSAVWFFGVAWAGQRLAPFLSRPDVWRVIDGIIVGVMFIMAVTLAAQALRQGQSLFR